MEPVTVIVGEPPSLPAVLLAGLTTLARPSPLHPVLPRQRLVRPRVMIDPAHLARYRQLCGFDDGHGVPPTYPHLLAFPLHLKLMMLRGFPYPIAGLVHVANRIVQHRAIAPDAPLTVSAVCGALRTHPRGQAFTIAATAGQNGKTVWESESSYLRIGAPSRLGEPLATLSAEGATTEIAAETVTRAIAPRYARLSGDRNPIHLSWLGARLFGFKRPIAHGMWTKARALALALPEPVDRITIDISFRAPILLPGRASFFVGSRDPAVDLAVRDGAGERLHLVGRLAKGPAFQEEPHAEQ
ncbi:MaoC family dehydratase [Sphingomonas sp. DT-207]